MAFRLPRLPSLRRFRPLITWPFWTLSANVFFNDNILETLSIDGVSMMPTLSPSFSETGAMDYVLFNKWSPASNLQRGDIVCFWAPHKADSLVVKRIVGLEGDTVLLDKRRMPRGEGPAAEKARRDWEVMGSWDWESGEVTRGLGKRALGETRAVRVPYGHVWVEGDHWRKTRDSNEYGPVSKSLITGRAMALVWPPERLGSRPWEKAPSATKVREGKALRPLDLD